MSERFVSIVLFKQILSFIGDTEVRSPDECRYQHRVTHLAAFTISLVKFFKLSMDLILSKRYQFWPKLFTDFAYNEKIRYKLKSKFPE